MRAAIALLLSLSACQPTLEPLDVPSDAPTSDAGASDAPLDVGAREPDGGTDAGACLPPSGPISREFFTLYETVIAPGCVGAGRFCHSGEYNFALVPAETAYANLVGARGCADVRVVPCRPDLSYAMHVIEEGGQPCDPPSSSLHSDDHPTAGDGYFDEAAVRAIEAWIASGAR